MRFSSVKRWTRMKCKSSSLRKAIMKTVPKFFGITTLMFTLANVHADTCPPLGVEVWMHTADECGPFVEVDPAGRLWTSCDRQTWTQSLAGIPAFLRGATYANRLFVAVGGSYVDKPAVILTSHDNGATWTRRSLSTKAN